MPSGAAIVWFRRDLRLVDHPALAQASQYETVIPIFIDDPAREGEWPLGGASRWWLSQSLGVLSAELARLGAPLLIFQGNTQTVLDALIEQYDVQAIFWNRRYEPAVTAADQVLKTELKQRGLMVESFSAQLLKEPWTMLKKDQTPYLVFTPFWKHFQATWTVPESIPMPNALKGPKDAPHHPTISAGVLAPDHPWTQAVAAHWTPGFEGGCERLDAFADHRVRDYDSLRNRPDHAGTSELSPHLHFGEISVGQAVRAMDPAGEVPIGTGPVAFVRELVWREFSHYLLFYFPHLDLQPLKGAFSDFPWREPNDYQDDLKAWQRGQTGVPMVDAGMRQLWQTGWMHNRVRMVVASYLTKNLLIPWQEGARWFWDTLVDADLANNTQGWQWTAGCGADASPYFRVFNPVLQGEKFDPKGEYVARWCPELQGLAPKVIHQPPECMDLKAQRQRALDAYAAIKKG